MGWVSAVRMDFQSSLGWWWWFFLETALLSNGKCLWGRSDLINLPSLKAGVQKCSGTSHFGDL